MALKFYKKYLRHKSHPLVKEIYLPRTVVIYCVMIMVVYELLDTINLFLTCIACFMLLWPHFIYLINNNLTPSKKSEFYFLNLDGILFGFLIAQLSFALMPAISMLSIRFTTDFSIGQKPLLMR